MDENSINYFNEMYIVGQVPMKISLLGSQKFGELKYAREFTDEEKIEFVRELIDRRYKVGFNGDI